MRGHIHDNVGRDASIFIRPPLEEIGIVERADAHWLSFIVDLRIEIGDLELRNVVSHGTHGAVAKQDRRILIDEGNLAIVHLRNISSEIGVFGNEDR